VGPVVALDTELFGMKRRHLHRETGTFASLAVYDGKTAYLITDQELLKPTIEAVRGSMWVMHNAVFDLFHLRRWTDIPDRSSENLWDTMIWERLLWSGYFNTFGLYDLARRYLDFDSDKKLRKRFEKATSMDWELRDYAITDVVVTFDVHSAQMAAINQSEHKSTLYRVWTEIECPLLEIVPKFGGFSLDEIAWRSMADKNQSIRDKAKASFAFNPDSPKQVKEALKLRGTHVINTQAGTLEKTNDPLAQSVLTYRKTAKLASTYGQKFVDDFLEADGCVHSHYWTVGASSGRFASADPNLQNIPSDKAFRRCFTASPAHKLVVIDYASQEFRILAAMSNDENLLDIFQHHGDPYARVARLLFGDSSITKKDPQRNIAKVVCLGLSYGMTSWGLARNLGVSQGEAEDLIAQFFRQFPGIRDYIKHYRWLGEYQGLVQTSFGRILWLNKYNKQWMNNAINSPIQGGAADQTKLALIYLYKSCVKKGLKYPVVAVVHDEIVADVPVERLDEYRELIRAAVIDAGVYCYPGVPWEAELLIGDTWAAKGKVK
jgi:DNA polymerase-1